MTTSVYFYCDECYNDNYGNFYNTPDLSVLLNIINTNCHVYLAYYLNCKRCIRVNNFISQQKHCNFSVQGITQKNDIVVTAISNNFYINEYGLFYYDLSDDLLTVTIPYDTSYKDDKITMEEFLNQVKLKSIIGVQIQNNCDESGINTIIEFFEKHLASKYYSIEKKLSSTLYNYFLVIESPRVKSASNFL